MLHAVNHSLAKGMLFLVAGNILGAYRTKSVALIRGIPRVLPVSGPLWLLGFFAISGTPPFGPFLSKFTIFRAAIDQDRPIVAAACLGLLGMVFVGMTGVVLKMAQGPAPERHPPRRESALSVAPSIALAALLLMLGVYLPPPLLGLLERASRALGGF
jgi:hydrogenase-4 component F